MTFFHCSREDSLDLFLVFICDKHIVLFVESGNASKYSNANMEESQTRTFPNRLGHDTANIWFDCK